MIRLAKKEDRRQIASLVLMILKDMEADILTRVEDQKVCHLLEKAMLDPTYRYGLARGLVYEAEGKVAGIAFGYPAAAEAKIDEPMDQLMAEHGLAGERLFTDEETFADEWYLDTLSVAERFRRKGIATQLLDAVDRLAVRTGEDKIGLCCDVTNQRAQRLYEKKGYQIVGQQTLGSHLYHHMQKKLD